MRGDSHWYWKHHGDLVGPISADELAKLIKSRRIHDDDQLRLSDEADWIDGATAKSLFDRTIAQEMGAADLTGGASAAASNLLRHARFSGATQSNSSAEGFVVKAIRSCFDLVWRCGIFAFECGIWPIVFCARWRKSWLSAVAVLFVLAMVAFSRFDPASTINQSIYDEFSLILEDIRLLRVNSTPAEWDNFREEQAEVLADATERLRRSEGAFNSRAFIRLWAFEEEDAEARYHLLQASYRLHELLRDNSDASDELFLAAEKHLNDAENVLAGDYLLQKARRKRDKEMAAANQRRGKSTRSNNVDLGFARIIAINALFWAVGSVMVWKWLR